MIMQQLRLLSLVIFAVVPSAAADDLPVVPDGFHIELVAKEPLVRNPCSMAFDARGRLCIGMGPQYRNPKPDTPGDMVVILIDEDHDGTFDSRKVFAKGFNCIQSLAWRGEELWVANAPDLTRVRDLDGDDVADEYTKIYTDLGNLEHGLHGLNWAPDGRLYMSKGNSKGLTKPGRIAPKPFRELWDVTAPDDAPDFPKPKTYRASEYRFTYHDPRDDWGREGGVLVCDRDGSNLEIVSRGFRNPWDIAFDSGFNWQGTDNDQTQGDRVFMPFFGAHFGWGHTWSAHWTGENHLPTVPITGPVFHGSGTGMVYYDATQFPEKYRRMWFFNDWLRRTTYMYRAKWEGALIQPEGGDWIEFVRGEKVLYKATDLEVGPEGTLYSLSWGVSYGAQFRGSEQSNAGRVYRIAWRGESSKSSRQDAEDVTNFNRDKVSSRSVSELIADFKGPLPVWRINAQDELLRRGNKARDELIKSLQSGHLTTAQQTWVAWTLGHLNDRSLDAYFEKQAMSDDVNLRIQSLRILAHRARLGKLELPAAVTGCLQDEEPRVRMAAVQALRRAKQTECVDALFDLAAKETDRIIFYASWQALRELLPVELRREKLQDSRAGVRRAVVLSLAEDRGLLSSDVEQLLIDEDFGVREIAAMKLPRSSRRQLLAIDPPGGQFEKSIQVNASTSVPSAEIRFTIDGSPPSETSTVWKGQLTFTETTLLKAAVFSNDRIMSSVAVLKFEKVSDDKSASRSGILGVRAKSGRRYRVVNGGLASGRTVYTDRKFIFKSIPPALEGSSIVQTPNDDSGSQGDDFIEMDTVLPVTFYVGNDKRIESPPDWLRVGEDGGFTLTDMTVTTSDSTLQLFQRRFQAGRITLGGNTDNGKGSGKSNYILIVVPAGLPILDQVTTMEHVLSQMKDADPQRGRALFFADSAAGCAKCHRIDGNGLGFGPDLSHLQKADEPREIIESILQPSAKITEGFSLQTIVTTSGKVVNGLLREETSDSLLIALPDGKSVDVRKADIDERNIQHVSPMPSFDRILSPSQVADIAAWLLSQKESGVSPEGAAKSNQRRNQ